MIPWKEMTAWFVAASNFFVFGLLVRSNRNAVNQIKREGEMWTHIIKVHKYESIRIATRMYFIDPIVCGREEEFNKIIKVVDL